MPRPSLAIACIVGLGLGASICVADVPVIHVVRIGVEGHFKRGHWAEVDADITSGSESLSGELEVISRDGDGASAAFVCPQPIELAAGQTGRFSALVKMGPPQSGLEFRIRSKGLTLARRELSAAEINGEWHPRDKTWKNAHRSTALVIATLGKSAGMESAVDLLSRSLGEESVTFELTTTDQLPGSMRGYDAIDCLVVAVADENPLVMASDERREALLQWLRLGGRMIVIAGDSAGAISDPSSPWAEVFGGALGERAPLATDAGLRSYAGESLDSSTPLQVWRINAPKARVLLSESGAGAAERPLVVENPVGLGRVSLVLLDLTSPPLREWKGRGRFLARLVSGDSLAGEPDAVRTGGRMTHLGYRDLAGQLRMALEQFSGVTPVHFHPVAGALLVYLILLGPGEYYLLRKAAPRAMHLTWLVFPLLVIGFAGGAIAWGRSARGSAVQVNQVEIVDLDLAGGQQRGAFWTSVFSPDAQNVSLTAMPGQVLPEAKLAGLQLAWQGLPGEGLGGIDAGSGGIGVAPLSAGASMPYEVHLGSEKSPASVNKLPLALASSKILAGNWQGTIPLLQDASQLRRGKLLEIEGSFRSVAPVPLKNAFLAHGDWMYRARAEVMPGAVINVANMDRKHLEYFFTRRNLLKEKDVATPWNQEETEIPRIMDIMMFHDALQGRSYTVLSHRYHDELDLSKLLHEGFAVLVGRSESPLVELEIDGKPLEEANVRRWTYYRILYPVAPRD